MKQTIYIYKSLPFFFFFGSSPFPIFRYQDVTFDIVRRCFKKKNQNMKKNKCTFTCRIKVFQWTACPCSLNVFILKFVFYCWNRTSCMGVIFSFCVVANGDTSTLKPSRFMLKTTCTTLYINDCTLFLTNLVTLWV